MHVTLHRWSILCFDHWMRLSILLHVLIDLAVELLLGCVEALAVSLGLVHETSQFFAHREIQGVQACLINKRLRRVDAVSRHLLNRRGLRMGGKRQQTGYDKESQLYFAKRCLGARARSSLERPLP